MKQDTTAQLERVQPLLVRRGRIVIEPSCQLSQSASSASQAISAQEGRQQARNNANRVTHVQEERHLPHQAECTAKLIRLEITDNVLKGTTVRLALQSQLLVQWENISRTKDSISV